MRLKAYAALTCIPEEDSAESPSATAMVRNLLLAQDALVRTARAVFPLAEEAGDESSADLLTQRMQVHEKTAWMLRSMLAEAA